MINDENIFKPYRKKPIVVEATKFIENSPNGWPEGAPICKDGDAYCISTLEGDMRLNDGDYIVRGIAGEYYPVKASIFEATYEAI